MACHLCGHVHFYRYLGGRMSTDRELLELAAKAVGVSPESIGAWNPLADDADALRLAVRLAVWKHQINIFMYRSEVTVYGPDEAFLCEYGDDAMNATRRAIVHAAARIGKDMP
jgi:hypothetical protein